MPERFEYEIKFSNYPDVVTTKELMLMLDGICEHTALSLLQKGKIKHFRIGNRYRIPKIYVIDFMMSDEYTIFRRKTDCAHLKKSKTRRTRKTKNTVSLRDTTDKKRFDVSLGCEKHENFFPGLLEPFVGIGRTSDD